MGFLIAALVLGKLFLEPPELLLRIVQLRESIPQLEPANVELEPFDPVGLIGLLLRERRNGKGNS